MSRRSTASAVVARSRASDVEAPLSPAPERTLRLVSSDATGAAIECESDEVTEASLLAFDPDDDLESVVPMPPSVPGALQKVLKRALVHRFEFYNELDAWLHAEHPALDGETPFERIVRGDGWGVLRAIGGDPTPIAHAHGQLAGAQRRLRLMR